MGLDRWRAGPCAVMWRSMAPTTDVVSTLPATAAAAAAHASPAAVDPSKTLSVAFGSVSGGDGPRAIPSHGCGCRLPPPSPAVVRGGGDKVGGGCDGVSARGGAGGVDHPAGFRVGLRASESIESFDGHLSDDSTRSVESITSVDGRPLGVLRVDNGSGSAAASKVSASAVLPSPGAPVVKAPATAAPPSSSLVAARAVLPLRRLNHISFTVASPAATANFFCDVLGYTRIVRPRSFDPSGIWLGWGVPVSGGGGGVYPGLQVHLIAGRPLDRPADVQSDRDHLSFEADDVEAVAQCLRARGIHFKDEAFEHEGLRQVRVISLVVMPGSHTGRAIVCGPIAPRVPHCCAIARCTDGGLAFDCIVRLLRCTDPPLDLRPLGMHLLWPRCVFVHSSFSTSRPRTL